MNAEDRVEDFFSDVLPAAFETYGNGEWTVTSDTMLQGEYAVRSAQIFDNQESVLELEQYTRDGYVSFYYKVSCEENNDALVFAMNGEEVARWSGEVPWNFYRMKIPSGNHTFTWKYMKDGNYSAGSDCAWVDYIKTAAVDSVVHETVTDSNGEAKFFNITPYNLLLLEGHSELHEISIDSLPGIQNDTTVNIELTRVYDLDFNVSTDKVSGNISVGNATVTLENDRSALTDSEGYTTFNRISIGNMAYTISAEGYYDLTGTVEVKNGIVTVDAALELIPEFRAANVITPNGDGYNDYWEIHNVVNYAGFEVSIYSASGERLFFTTDYPNNKWNGMSADRRLPDGIYYYIIVSPYEDLVFKGVINLIN